MCEVSRPTLKHPAWWLLAVPMAVPALLVVAALAAMLFYSFTDFDVLTPAVFVGLQNYARLFSEPLYWRAVGNTLLYLLVAGRRIGGPWLVVRHRCGASAPASAADPVSAVWRRYNAVLLSVWLV